MLHCWYLISTCLYRQLCIKEHKIRLIKKKKYSVNLGKIPSRRKSIRLNARYARDLLQYNAFPSWLYVLEGTSANQDIDTLLTGKMLLRRKTIGLNAEDMLVILKQYSIFPIVSFALQDIPVLLQPHKAAPLQCKSRFLILLGNCYVHVHSKKWTNLDIDKRKGITIYFTAKLFLDKMQFHTSIGEGRTEVTWGSNASPVSFSHQL